MTLKSHQGKFLSDGGGTSLTYLLVSLVNSTIVLYIWNSSINSGNNVKFVQDNMSKEGPTKTNATSNPLHFHFSVNGLTYDPVHCMTFVLASPPLSERHICSISYTLSTSQPVYQGLALSADEPRYQIHTNFQRYYVGNRVSIVQTGLTFGTER